VEVIIYEASGVIISSRKYVSVSKVEIEIKGVKGFYIIEVMLPDGIIKAFKVIKY
jgi:hypothetical protein